MKALQVFLAEADAARLEEWSRQRGWSKSQAVRVAVRALTRPRGEDPLLDLSGSIVDGLPPDASTEFDRHLQETFVAKRPSRSGRAPRVRR